MLTNNPCTEHLVALINGINDIHEYKLARKHEHTTRVFVPFKG